MLTFADPIWLVALLPWGIFSIWMMLSRRKRVDVPFVKLWRSNDATTSRRMSQRLQPPPVAVVCMLLAMLVGLIAAARPQVRRTIGAPITIVVDRGATMLGASLKSTSDAIVGQFNAGPVRLIQVPGETTSSDRSDWTGQLLPATGLDTRDSLIAAVADATRGNVGAVVVVSNQELPASRAVQIWPGEVSNVGIVRFSARISPKPAALVRLRNDSNQTTATLRLNKQSREIELPQRGAERDYFFDFPDTPAVIAAELTVADENPADHRAWLVRGESWPRIEAQASVPAALEKMIAVYRKQRPPGETSPRVVVTDNVQRVRPDQIALIVQSGEPTTDAPTRVVDHPLTRNVQDWTALHQTRAAFPADGWTPIVSAGENILAAVREQPARQVWIGADLSSFARTSDFVVFFANVFDWLAGASPAEEYRAEPVSDDALRWTRADDLCGPASTAAPSPGVYRDAGGALHALNIVAPPPTQPSIDPAIALYQAAQTVPLTWGSRDISRYLLDAALALIAFAALFWRANAAAS